MIVRGTIGEFHRYIGPHFRNAVNRRTTGEKSRRLGWCDGFERERHHVGGYEDLDFAHPPERGRKEILDEILSRHKISDTAVECDLGVVEKEFWAAHETMFKNGAYKYLCKPCHDRMDHQ
jgi:hypothetical protein